MSRLGITRFGHRVFDIDRVMSKAIVNCVLAAFVTAAYLTAISGLQAVAGNWAKSTSALSIFAAALVAVMFQPVRRWIQHVANRVVYGQRATPYEALAALSRRMRDPIADETVLLTMAKAVAEGIDAVQGVVWLAWDTELRPAAVWPEQRAAGQQLRLVDVQPPLGTEVIRTIPIHDEGELLGALTVTRSAHEPITPAEDKLLYDLAAQAGLVLRNVRLVQDLKASRQRILAAQDAERRRLERDIHDSAQQRLITLSLALRLAGARSGVAPGVAANLETAAQQIQHCLVDLRDLARGVHPVLLTEEGLGPALDALAQRSPIPARVISGPIARMPAPVEVTAYQVGRQALAAAVDAGATSVTISAWHADGELVVEVADDRPPATGPGASAGLPGLDDRVAALDGSIHVEARAGYGSVVRAVIPCGSS